MPTDSDKSETLLDLVRQAISLDQALREQYEIGDKFRFIRDRLLGLLNEIELSLPQMLQHPTAAKAGLAEDEILAYVYLYNAHGALLRSWQNMLTAKTFYEYSVNRPIYIDKMHIESLVQSKKHKAQHAFFSVVIKRADILPGTQDNLIDALGHTFIKVKEGALRLEKLVVFIHEGNEYCLNESGDLILKS